MELNKIKNLELSKNWRWTSGFLHLIYEKDPIDIDDIKFNEETTNKVLDLLNKTNSDKDKYIKKFILMTLKLLEESRIEKEKTFEKYNELKDKLLSFLKPEKSIVKNKDSDVITASHIENAINKYKKKKFEQTMSTVVKRRDIDPNVGSIIDNLLNNRDVETKFYFFFTDWCTFCQEFKPEWEKLKAESNLGVKLEEVNCTEINKQGLVSEYNVSGYPTFILENGSKKVIYNGKYDALSIINFIKYCFIKDNY